MPRNAYKVMLLRTVSLSNARVPGPVTIVHPVGSIVLERAAFFCCKVGIFNGKL